MIEIYEKKNAVKPHDTGNLGRGVSIYFKSKCKNNSHRGHREHRGNRVFTLCALCGR